LSEVNQIANSRFSVGNGINQSGKVVGQTTLGVPNGTTPIYKAFLYNYSTNTVTVIDNVSGRQSVSVADSPQRLSTELLCLCRYLLPHTTDFAIEIEPRLGRR
jgi:hypothetical protein